MATKNPSSGALEAAGHELKVNPPAQLARTAAKFGKADADKQRIAIMFSKARKGTSGIRSKPSALKGGM